MNQGERLKYLERICDGESLNEMPFEAQDDERIVLAAVRTNWRSFQYASDRLKADKDFVLDVIGVSSSAFQYASDELRADKDFVLAAVGKRWLAFLYASPELKADKNVVLAAVRADWRAFLYASEEVKKDEELQRISQIYSNVDREKACDNYLIRLNSSRKKSAMTHRYHNPRIQNSNQDKNETPKRKIENLLIQYIQDREKERNDNRGREYNHFYAFVKRGTSASVKINAANKLLKIIRDGDNFDFNKEELKALDDGRLGNIFSRYKNTVATQPRVFTKVSI